MRMRKLKENQPLGCSQEHHYHKMLPNSGRPCSSNGASEQVRWLCCRSSRHLDRRLHLSSHIVTSSINYGATITTSTLDTATTTTISTCTASRLSPLSYGDTKRMVSSGLKHPLLFSIIVILSLVALTSDCSNNRLVSAYQLTNNLIANNLPPKFITTTNLATSSSSNPSEIVVRVKEGPGSIGKLIYTLRGEDPDDDPLSFNVMGSMASDLLRIENVPGNQANVYLRKELDRETTESYQVVITLTDGKLGRGNWVEDVNDNYPVFNPHRTAISVREDSQVPLVIETLEATDQDEGRFGQVIYKLEQLDNDHASAKSAATTSMFSIETIDGRGVLTLIHPLDYEQKALYQLRITAIDRAVENERLSATTNILISVEDCEDQPPMFTFVPSITRIPEDLPVGAPIVRVAASDGDRGVNRPIQYRLVSVNGHDSGAERNLFSISPDSGQVSVAHELDRESPLDSANGLLSSRKEQPGSYVLQVSATEVGSSTPEQSVTTELTILLTDVNDEAPTFNQAAYHGEILENSAPESLVTFVPGPSGSIAAQNSQPTVIRVVDRDQGTNGTFSLHLEGEHSHLFEVWPLEATNEANLMIKVKAVQEGSDNNKLVLDYEKQKIFEFDIVATEKFPSHGRAPKSSSARLSVHLKDSNDNYPQFEHELYRVEVPENAIKGMHICAVKAVDIDSGLFGTQGIRYTEIRGEKANKFKMDPLTGVITLRTNDHGFDRETIPQHHLILEARDANGSGNRNTTQLLIVLTDVNDQRPKFLLDQYEAFIYENEPDFQSPLQIQAIDNDSPNSPNSRIVYSIVGGDPQQNFTIDPSTGRIRVRQMLVITPATLPSDLDGFEPSTTTQSPNLVGLDFEHIPQKRDETRQFNLTVRATDSGSPEQLSDQAQVIIVVYDKNDHAPVFTRSVYTKSVREDAKEGSPVLQVLALDGDHSPTNSKITYRISSGASDKFVIDSESGLVSVANGANLDIDRVVGGQRRTNYQLNVIALDSSFGPNQKSASAIVNITIIDVNNKAPEFVSLGASSRPNGPMTTMSPNPQQLMVVYVNEDAPYGLIVTRVVATDLDSGSELRYSINWARSEARNEDMILVDPSITKDLFTIEPTDGTIKVSKQLDRELFDQVKLRLQVEDIAAQTSDQVAHAHLLIKITDVNDNRPTFKRPVYKAVVNENSISGTQVITMTADDRDVNKTLRYSLDGSPEMLRLVRVNPRSGEIIVNDKIDRELHPLINVTVRAEDYGMPQSLTGTAQLLITIRDENDNNPMFLNSSQLYPSSVASQDALASHRSRRLGSQSVDQPKNHQGDYKYRSLRPPGPLEEAITVLPATIDYTIDEPAGLAERLPFLSPGATARIREDAPIGHQVAFVRAEDADLGNNGRVTYLIDGTSSGGKFRIDRDTGIISVAGTLDRETTKLYSLIIEACDNYDLGHSTGESRRAFTQVNIQIVDINDNVPIISTNLQTTGAGSTKPLQPEGQTDRTIMHSPSYDDIMSSPGPYDLPLSECLFINEFQPLNEPILTVTATDADDPNTGNGQIELTIVNNLPQNELFSLVLIPATASSSKRVADTTPISPTTTTDSLGPMTTNTSIWAVDSSEEPSDSLSRSLRAKRSEPLSSNLASIGNIYSRSSASTGGSRQRQLTVQLRSLATATQPPMTTTVPPNLFNPPATMASVSLLGNLQLNSADSIGEQQAHVVVNQSLKERVGNYSILVRATDRGQPALSSIKVINICVQDVNNHAPVFTKPPLNHTIRVMENATLGTFVTQIEATDGDYGINGELQYSLKPTNIQNNSNDWQSFKIDRLSGIITTAKSFNRQLKKYYTLRVQAQDFGRPTSLSSDIDINIMIVNSGQYQPEFDQQLQTLQFTENLAPGVEWFTLFPTTNLDDDPALIHENNKNIHANWLATPCYFIVDGDDHEQVFHLDRYTHRLTNQKSIDRERKANYTLLVQATNNCNSVPMYARPLHESRGQMQSEQSTSPSNVVEYRSSLVEQTVASSPLGTKLTRVERSSQEVSSNATSAKLVQMTDTMSFNEATVDALLIGDKTLLKVFIKVKDLNDNAPRFTQRVYTGGITTDADYGTVFMIVQAIDADADNNSQVTYSIVKPIKRSLATSSPQASRQRRSPPEPQKLVLQSSSSNSVSHLVTTTSTSTVPTPESGQQLNSNSNVLVEDNLSGSNDIILPTSESDDLFMINAQNGEISLNFDPQKHMKGYFEFEIMAKDADGLSDSAKVFIYLLRQDQRVKFVLRLTPQELRQRLNKFRSVFGNITGAIVNIDSYKYFENHDGTVDKKKTSLYLHFVNPDDNTIIEVDKVILLIDNNIEYLNELYKEFHVLSSEAAHLPLSSSALVDPMDQVRTGLLGISTFLTLILVLVIALCVNQRIRYERQLKAATVSAFGGSPLHLDSDYQSQTNLPNTNLHSQDPNPIWMNGYSEQDWLGGANGKSSANINKNNNGSSNHHDSSANCGLTGVGIEDADYLSSEHSDMNSLSGVNSGSQLHHYNAATTATPRDSLNSSHGRASGTGSGSTSTTNDQQVLCRGGGSQTPVDASNRAIYAKSMKQQLVGDSQQIKSNNSQSNNQTRSQLVDMGANSVPHSTFGAFKEVTIYTDHQQFATNQGQQQKQLPPAHNLVRTVGVNSQATSQVNKIANQLNAKHQARASQGATGQVYINQINQQQQQQQQQGRLSSQPVQQQHRILVHANGTDASQGIIKTSGQTGQGGRLVRVGTGKTPNGKLASMAAAHQEQQHRQQQRMPSASQKSQIGDLAADSFENNLSKLSILNLETTEL